MRKIVQISNNICAAIAVLLRITELSLKSSDAEKQSRMKFFIKKHTDYIFGIKGHNLNFRMFTYNFVVFLHFSDSEVQ